MSSAMEVMLMPGVIVFRAYYMPVHERITRSIAARILTCRT